MLHTMDYYETSAEESVTTKIVFVCLIVSRNMSFNDTNTSSVCSADIPL